jgi:hypothetical protein
MKQGDTIGRVMAPHRVKATKEMVGREMLAFLGDLFFPTL